MSEKLSVVITCKNERMNIRPCIEAALPVADEILLADTGSTDGTMEIARSFPLCRVIEREYLHAGDIKNWAIPQAQHPWVLVLDADERVTAALREEIREVLRQPDEDGYSVSRLNYFMGHRIRFSGWQGDRVVRLFRRDLVRYPGDTDHATARISSGRVGRLRRSLEHYTYWSYDQYMAKFHRYTTYQAQAWRERGKRPSVMKLLLNGPLRFLQAYILRLGFLDGAPGIQLCLLTGFYSFMKQARLWEAYHALPQPDPEKERQVSGDGEPHSG